LHADDEKAGTARKRAALRLLCELNLMGVHHNTLAIVGIVRTLAAADPQRDASSYQAALSLLSAFAKAHRLDFLGLPPRPPLDLCAAALPEVRSRLIACLEGKECFIRNELGMSSLIRPFIYSWVSSCAK
jgi:hypothetical protein